MVFDAGTPVDLGLLGRGTISQLLGQGGQGQVYEIVRATGAPLALKWYKPQSATEDQFRRLRTLIDFGAPHSRFIWPLSMARVGGAPGFGYVMAVREDSYLELSCLLAAKTPAGESLDVSFAAVLSVARQLSYSFLRLHAAGLCYRDISFGNVFFEPERGDILICDNDNVGVDNGSSRVLGTPFFMAPEVVRDRTYQTLPNIDTDRHSLAVLLFYVLCVGHPFEGQRTGTGLRDEAWLVEHLGDDPVFCMHPDREDNRPAALVQAYWELYPAFVRNLFVHAFVHGAADPSMRVTESQWVKAIDGLRDGMMTCRSCGATAFWDPAQPGRSCSSCHQLLAPDFVLDLGRRKVVTAPQATLSREHLTPGIDDPSPIGQLVRHPHEQTRWALRNVSHETWTARYPSGDEFRIEAGGTIELEVGLRLRLATTVVTVRKP
jgi:eukaryotic-like serine/threonine-protein kinase